MRLSALRDNDVSMPLRRFDKFEMHRPNCALVLLQSSLKCTAAFRDVPSQPTHQSNVVRSINKYADVQKAEYTRLGENQDTFYDHNGLWLNTIERVAAG